MIDSSQRRQIRADLLAEHEHIRGLLRMAGHKGQGFLAGTVGELELEAALELVRTTLHEHNQREEAAIARLLAGCDPWNPRRIARMLEEHAAEHVVLRQALAGAVAEVAARLADVIEELDAHMAAEERTFLSSSVLIPAT